MKIILDDLSVKVDTLMQLYYDDKSVMNIAHNPVWHTSTKLIKIDRHFSKNNLDRDLVIKTYDLTELQIPNIFTKGLLRDRFQELIGKLGIINVHY